MTPVGAVSTTMTQATAVPIQPLVTLVTQKTVRPVLVAPAMLIEVWFGPDVVTVPRLVLTSE